MGESEFEVLFIQSVMDEPEPPALPQEQFEALISQTVQRPEYLMLMREIEVK